MTHTNTEVRRDNMKKTDTIVSLALGMGLGYMCAYMKKHPIKMQAMKNDLKSIVKDLK